MNHDYFLRQQIYDFTGKVRSEEEEHCRDKAMPCLYDYQHLLRFLREAHTALQKIMNYEL
jgi:hypothetical protein